jgi:hypothetical protein
LLLILALFPTLLALNSCGSSSTPAATPSITVSGAATSVSVNGTVQFTASILNLSSTLVNWQAGGLAGGNSTFGTIDANGLYTAPKTVPTNNIVTITAIAQAQTTLTGTASVTILQPTKINSVVCLDPASKASSLNVASGESLACSALTAEDIQVPVFWQVNGIANPSATLGFGTMSAQGNYVAPLIPPAGGTVTITAVSQADSTQTMSVTVTDTFGNAVLQGPYAFSTSGRVISGNSFFARAGSFVAGGDGTLIGIAEDYNQVGQALGATQLSFTGIYSISTDGRGTMEFCENISTACTPAAATAFFRIAVASPLQAQIIEFSKPNSSIALSVGSGEMDSQDSSVFNNGGLSGVYSFNFSGLSSLAAPQSEVGEFDANGLGVIRAGSTNTPALSGDTPGKMDINSGGEQFLTASTYSIGSNGRGTAIIGSSTFSFYLFSASRAIFIEADASAILVGDAIKQQPGLSSPCAWGNNALNGMIVFGTAGTKSGAGITDLVSFKADGNGGVTSGSIDEHDGGAAPTQATSLAGTYSVDACGRGTVSIPATAPNHTYVFYMTSVNSAVIQEISTGVVAHGTMVQPMGGPFNTASLSGSYALHLAGTNALSATSGNEEDLVGQLTSSGSSGAITAGSVDVNNAASDLGATQTIAGEIGTYTVTDATTGRATMTLSSPQNLVLYLVSPTQAFAMVGGDNTGIVASGSLFKQF